MPFTSFTGPSPSTWTSINDGILESDGSPVIFVRGADLTIAANAVAPLSSFHVINGGGTLKNVTATKIRAGQIIYLAAGDASFTFDLTGNIISSVGRTINAGRSLPLWFDGTNFHDLTSVPDAGAMAFTPYGNISATDVQAAIQELDDEKAGLALANTFVDQNTFEDSGFDYQLTLLRDLGLGAKEGVKVGGNTDGFNVFDKTGATLYGRVGSGGLEWGGGSAITDSDQVAQVGVTNVFSVAQSFAAGSAAAPSIRFSGDPDTGLYSYGANELGFTAGGISRGVIGVNGLAWGGGSYIANSNSLTLSFNGRQGAVVPLQADYDAFFLTPTEGDAAYARLGATNTLSGTNNFTGSLYTPAVVREYASGNAWFQYSTDTRIINLNAAGLVAIRDATNTSDLFRIYESGNAQISGTLAWVGDPDTYISNVAANTIAFYTAGSGRLNITSAGHIIPWNSSAQDIGGTSDPFRTFYVNEIDFRGATTSTSATAGAASALPSNPLGYLSLKIAGTTVKIPYYSA